MCVCLMKLVSSNGEVPLQEKLVNSKPKCKILDLYLTLVNQTLKKPAGLPSGWGRVAPKERKM